MKEACPECESGFYELAIEGDDEQITKAFCDLTTDGGKLPYYLSRYVKIRIKIAKIHKLATFR